MFYIVRQWSLSTKWPSYFTLLGYNRYTCKKTDAKVFASREAALKLCIKGDVVIPKDAAA